MNDLRMIFKLECKCGKVLEIDTDKSTKVICPKCGEVIFEKADDSYEYSKGKV